MSWSQLDENERQYLINLYENCELTADELPYTPVFDRMHAQFVAETANPLTPHDFWRALSSARKTGQLTRKKR
jgi:hypothetical protein